MRQAQQDKKTSFSDNLKKTYRWICDGFLSKLKESTQVYWFCDLDYKLVSVSENSNFFFKGEEYFVTRIKVGKNLFVVIRLSKSAVGILLEDALGQSEKNVFEISELTELEAKILTAYNSFLFKNIEPLLERAENINKNEQDFDFHLTFFIKNKKDNVGKIIISAPIKLINPEFTTLGEDVFSISDFPNLQTEVNIKVGSSKALLSDLKSLENGDIVMLDKSNLNTMQLNIAGTKIKFKINPDPALIVDVEDNGGNIVDNKAITKDLWDTIQVDISAEFEKVKMSLGELKQISEGLVVDIGSVFDNKIDLKVENRIIATGELVIINDRYGVRVDRLLEKQDLPAVIEQNQNPTPEIRQEQTGNEEENVDEEFDYSDFDLDEEDV